MIFGWFRRRRRRQLMERLFPDEWRAYLESNFAQYGWLSKSERARLHGLTQVIVAEKHWEGCNGLAMSEEIQVTIAAQAALLVLNLPDEYFDRVLSILVYPGAYVARQKTPRPGGVIIEADSARLGEAWEGGALVLSWPDVLASGRVPDDGVNVVFHEFAHVLDMQEHGFDGVPLLENREQYQTWSEVMSHEYRRLIHSARSGQETLLDPYGTVNEAEFFAVATESFFERPLDMEREHPALYKLFRDFFHQDPAQRFRGLRL